MFTILEVNEVFSSERKVGGVIFACSMNVMWHYHVSIIGPTMVGPKGNISK